MRVQSMALANSTFTPNVAKGAVGTVSVTMSDGSAFSGKLSITGTNSGGFQLSGNTLEEKASGTPAGTYHDFNVVAAQSTASNSPQQISPTVTGVVEAPFGGTARSMTNRIQAKDFDVGGYSVTYRATDVCGIGIDTAYGADRLNVYPTADLDGGSNLKIGCNQAGDWHNYTINAATTGAYTLNMRVANIETGAAYHVAIDGATVVKGITVPNTGGYDTFATVTSAPFGLTAGQHVWRLCLMPRGHQALAASLTGCRAPS
jgi:Carbohydrate binding module (family 6)